MSTDTANYGFTKDNEDDFYNVNVVNDNLDKIDLEMKRIEDESKSFNQQVIDNTNAIANANTKLDTHIVDYVKHPGYGVTTNVGAAYAVTLNPAPPEYKDGLGLLLKLNVDTPSNGFNVNVNGLGAKHILTAKGFTLTSPLKKDSVVSLRYSSTAFNGLGAFILQGEGGAGNAQPSEVLTGKTFTNDNGDATGTMPDKTGTVIVPTTNDLVIPEGYYKNAKVQGVFIVPLEAPKSDGSTTFSVFYNPYFGGTTSTTYFPMTRKTWLGGSGIIEISFSMYSYGSAGLIKARIYINGQPRGIERSLNSTSSQTFTENFNINKGDFIEWMLMKVDSAPLSANMVSERIQIKGFTMVN